MILPASLSAAVAAWTILASYSPAPAVSDYEMCGAAIGAIAHEACDRVIAQGGVNLGALADKYIDRGQIHYTQGRYDNAIADFDQAARLDPFAPLAYGNRANAYAMTKRYERALIDYSQAIDLDPAYTAAYTGRGLIYEARGNREKAWRDFSAALAVEAKYQDGLWAQQTARAHLSGFTDKPEASKSTAPQAAAGPKDGKR
jgi:tetratricopeptide (TPR) repeat protein